MAHAERAALFPPPPLVVSDYRMHAGDVADMLALVHYLPGYDRIPLICSLYCVSKTGFRVTPVVRVTRGKEREDENHDER